jgi:hypothetical protein
LRALVLSPLVRQRVPPFVSMVKNEDLVVLKKLMEVGKVTPVIDRTYPLSEVPEAIGYLEEGHSLKEKSSSPCEANPKEDPCSQSGGEDVDRGSRKSDSRPGGAASWSCNECCAARPRTSDGGGLKCARERRT